MYKHNEDKNEESSNISQSQIIKDEYQIWKKNSHNNYNTLIINVLAWPSLTVNWLPDLKK